MLMTRLTQLANAEIMPLLYGIADLSETMSNCLYEERPAEEQQYIQIRP